MKIKTDYVPEDCDYLTVGKEYEAHQSGESNRSYAITADNGEEVLVDINECAHLDDHAWTIVQDGPQFSQEQAREMYELVKEVAEGNYGWITDDAVIITNKLESSDG